MTLDQQIADEFKRMMAFHPLGDKNGDLDHVVFAEAWANHAANNRPSSFVNAQLLEAAKEVQDVGRELWGNADIEQALDSLDGAIANADKVAS